MAEEKQNNNITKEIMFPGKDYDNFPLPQNPTNTQKQTIETAAQNVLDVREKFPNARRRSEPQIKGINRYP